MFVEGTHARGKEQNFHFRKDLGLPMTKSAFFDPSIVAHMYGYCTGRPASAYSIILAICGDGDLNF